MTRAGISLASTINLSPEFSGYDHIGDGDYFEGSLYTAVESYSSCSAYSKPAVFVFDAESLLRVRVVDLMKAEEVSGAAVLPERHELWISSYCDGTRLWIYDVDSLEFMRAVGLRPRLSRLQGLAYRDGNFYAAQNNGKLRRISLSGTTEQVFQTDSPGAHEGLDYSQQELRWLIDEGQGQQRIHFLVRK